MIVLREISAAMIFVVGVVFLFDILSAGFSWEAILLSLFCFVLAYVIWPSKKKGQRQDYYGFLDVLEFVIEMPFEILKWFFRLLGRIFSGKGDGIDIDF